MTDRLVDLEERLGHHFTDKELLQRALTHGSATGRGAATDNERLEFLGDRVLGLLAAEALVARFPKATEGELAPRLNALVRRETCAAVAAEFGLDKHMVLAISEVQSGGRRKPAILADACEAVMAAVYLDGGLDAARWLFRRFWSDRLGKLDKVPIDAKTRLQEWLQGQGKPVPAYRVVDRSGPDHLPLFRVEVTAESLEPAFGSGRSKRVAEQAAARALLEREAPQLANPGGVSSGAAG